ncbi:MAG TPA: polyphosphate polymerase domain-containing protein [Actinomycetales bacterium]|nr:polyphosphate polymerase domain-containing protein [Actinomycetales bacterium]
MSVVACLPPIGLAELDDVAARQVRRDRKYVLALDGLDRVLSLLPHGTRVLEIEGERTFGYSSLYLDTPALETYHAAGLKRRRRAKVRLRRYEATGAEFLEVKLAGPRGMTVKHRRPHNGELPLSADSLAFVDGILAPAHVRLATRALRPVLATRYARTTLCLPGDDGPARATLDLHLTCRTPGGEGWGRDGFGWGTGGASTTAGEVLDLGGLVVVETKGGVRSTELDRILWRLGHRPCRFSKYGVGLAALTPGLPPEKWFRALDHHVPAALAA